MTVELPEVPCLSKGGLNDKISGHSGSDPAKSLATF